MRSFIAAFLLLVVVAVTANNCLFVQGQVATASASGGTNTGSGSGSGSGDSSAEASSSSSITATVIDSNGNIVTNVNKNALGSYTMTYKYYNGTSSCAEDAYTKPLTVTFPSNNGSLCYNFTDQDNINRFIKFTCEADKARVERWTTNCASRTGFVSISLADQCLSFSFQGSGYLDASPGSCGNYLDGRPSGPGVAGAGQVVGALVVVVSVIVMMML